ncbi:hypothetical protein ACIBO2_26225 [Nonomuraea sp. NPDC050022]|uniref:hypothetical protein n=1 Tax=Nonomuraea sp. NPDC050022 TaxID=3364358 RepID=UPI00379EB478
MRHDVDVAPAMTPLEAVIYYDDPANAQFMCDMLMSARPGWTVWRGEDRIWRARRNDWPEEYPPLATATAGLLNLVMRFIDEGEAA